MSNIQRRKQNLPVKPKDLQKYILIGKVKLKAHIAALSAIKKIDEGFAARQAALEDTQDMGESLLYAESHLGSMLATMDKSESRRASRRGSSLRALPKGITHKDSHLAQELNRHEDIIAEVVAIAREKGEIPLRHKVLKKIKDRKPKAKTPKLPEGRYNVIYADPPWQYDNSGLLGSSSEHYQTMPLEDIQKLKDKTGKKIQDCITSNAILFLWTTNPFLEDALKVVNDWGFNYKTNICWEKEGRSTYGKLGFYVYGQHELLLIAVRGSFLPTGKLPKSIIKAKKQKHSRKPDMVYDIIEQMYPKGKYLELFARKKHSKKWTAWGLEL